MKLYHKITRSVVRLLLRKRVGIIRDHVCLHADSPYYAKKYGLVKREREKYERILDTANASLYKAD